MRPLSLFSLMFYLKSLQKTGWYHIYALGKSGFISPIRKLTMLPCIIRPQTAKMIIFIRYIPRKLIRAPILSCKPCMPDIRSLLAERWVNYFNQQYECLVDGNLRRKNIRRIYILAYLLLIAVKCNLKSFLMVSYILVSMVKSTTPSEIWSGGRINIKIASCQYRKSHCGDKTILRLPYLHNGISYTDKMASLYWIRDQVETKSSYRY